MMKSTPDKLLFQTSVYKMIQNQNYKTRKKLPASQCFQHFAAKPVLRKLHSIIHALCQKLPQNPQQPSTTTDLSFFLSCSYDSMKIAFIVLHPATKPNYTLSILYLQ